MTENVTKTVPVSHEEVRVEREPITDANVGAAKSGPDISEEEHEVVLREERPVVEKDVVPTERVRLTRRRPPTTRPCPVRSARNRSTRTLTAPTANTGRAGVASKAAIGLRVTVSAATKVKESRRNA